MSDRASRRSGMHRAAPRSIRRLALVATVIAVGAATAIVAAGPDEITGPVRATERAERQLPEAIDVVTVHDSGPLDDETRRRAIDAAERAGATWSVVQTVSSAMTRLSRNGATIQAPPADFSVPMSTTFLERDVISTLMGEQILAGLTDRTLIMSSGTAALRGAEAGDTVTLRHVTDGTRDFTISQIVSDAITGGTELLMLPSAATRLGVERESSVLMWGFPTRDSMMFALFAAGVLAVSDAPPGAIYDPPGSARPIRVRRSWDPRNPDSTLGMSTTKRLLGEFSYRVNDDSVWVTVDSGWTSVSLPSSRQSIGIGVRASCHQLIEPALRGALAEIEARGLAGTIDVDNANAAGGCFAPRFNRLAPDSSVGFLSRHTWAMAIDLNTVRDCQGCDPPSLAVRTGGCDTVRIFREWGFAWGGNFTTADGMHFEYVGEDRSQIPFPSRYCANQPSGNALVAEPSIEQTERSVLFADAGLVDGHSHD